MTTIQNIQSNFVAVIRKESGYIIFAVSDDNDFSGLVTEGRELLKTYEIPASFKEIGAAVMMVRNSIVKCRPSMELQMALIERCFAPVSARIH